MMKRMAIFLSRVVSAFFVLCFAFLLLIFFLGETQQGSAFLYASLRSYVAPFFTCEKFEGALWRDFTLRGAHFKSKSGYLIISSARVAWQPLHLLYGQLSLSQLELSGLVWQASAPPVKKDKTSAVSFEWFRAIHVANILIHDWEVVTPSFHFVGKEVSAQLDGEHLNTPQPQWSFNLKNFQSVLQNHLLQGRGKFFWAQDTWRLEDVRMQVADAFIYCNGVLGSASNFVWQFHLPDLSYWFPNATGKIESSGVVKGNWMTPSASGYLHATDVQFLTYRLSQADIQVRIEAAQDSVLLEARGAKWHWKTYSLDKIALHVAGTMQKLQLYFEASQMAHEIRLWAQGALQNGALHAQLQRLLLNPDKQVLWTLAHPVDFVASPHTFVMQQKACVRDSVTSLCVQAKVKPEAQDFFLDSSWINLATWKDFFNDQVVFSRGAIKAHADVQVDHRGEPSGGLKLELRDVSATWQVTKESALPITMPQATIEANIANRLATLKTFMSGNIGVLKSTITVPNWRNDFSQWKQQPLQGNISWELSNLAFLQPLLPAMQGMQGKLLVNADISGTLNTPRVYLEAELKQAAWHFFPYNINFKNIVLRLKGWLDQKLELQGGFDTDDGRIALTGDATQLFSTPLMHATLKGSHVLVANLPSYKIWASPDLKLTYTPPGLTLTGTVMIPKASLNFVDYGDQVVDLSSDIIYVDTHSTALQVNADLSLRLGNQVDFQFGGLRGFLRGGLQLQQMDNAVATAMGKISLAEGTYEAYGQKLTIQKAYALYNGGDVANPDLMIQAVKVLQDVMPLTADGTPVSTGQWVNPDGSLTVGVVVHGPLRRYQITLFSNPPGLSQSDVLSYLVLGVPTSQVGSGGGQLLFSAASALGGGKAGGAFTKLQNDLQNTFGLQVGMGTISQYNPSTQSVVQGTGLILTKALSPKLYLIYSTAVGGQAVNILKVRYQMNKRWIVQSESSSYGNGADIFYTIDRK